MRVLLRATIETPGSESADDRSTSIADFLAIESRRWWMRRELPQHSASRRSRRDLDCRRSRCWARRGRPTRRCVSGWAQSPMVRCPNASLRAWAAPLRPLTLLAASDGNHGRAVARVACWLGLGARIFIPNFVSPGRRRAIEAEGAELVVIDGVYDASVDAAIDASHSPGTLLITDTARSPSDVIPQLVTAGYTTAFVEAERQVAQAGDDRIDVVAVQAGVGGLASAGTSWARVTRRGRSPRVIVVEPEGAACVMAALASGEPVTVSANQITAMSVLQCGTMSVTAFASLLAGVSCCIAIEDSWTGNAVVELAACDVRTGPSGAAGIAGLLAAFNGAFGAPIRNYLGLSADARVLAVATESSAAENA